MRLIVLDTETTGFDPAEHRIVEIGCVELINSIPSGKVFHHYLNPQRAMPKEAEAVHGLSDAFLADKKLFAEVVADFLEFIGEDQLVIHNAGFDMDFLNAELKAHGYATLPMQRAIDTVTLARRLFPGAPASLDALCKRFAVDATSRTVHGALLDARLLADVYLELIGGKQPGLDIAFQRRPAAGSELKVGERQYREPRSFPVSAGETSAHDAAVAKLKNSLWSAIDAA